MGDPLTFAYMFEKMWPTFLYDLVAASFVFFLLKKLEIKGDNNETLEVVIDEHDVLSFEEAQRAEEL